ncbi:serine/threonine-protein kinase ULK2 [Paragonimus westermani]|uniref:Serine/threonine-protein kinase ULK2 n=1 Tax=Paragonimus westermani TaxID=34504 RepID=A0A5J4NSS1_9TREM|nr:serine/threonine-protein kinase ULK2 [Paragonimus westermani]
MSVLCSQDPKTSMTTLGAYEYNPTHANLLGTGAFALVYKGRVKNKPDEPVAIKIMKKDTNMPKNKTLLSKEISVLKDLHHENIVRLYDHGVTKGTLPEDTIRHFLLQIGSAMDAINRKGFMHRDLKPGNILLSHCRNCNQPVTEIPGYLLSFKLAVQIVLHKNVNCDTLFFCCCSIQADFGFARFLQDGMMAVTMCGSPMYMAPEVLMCRKYDAVADIWSMGIIVYQCLTGKAPFYANNPEALKNIYEKTVCLKPKIPIETSRPLRDLLLRMLVRKPSERIDFDNFLNHPFLHQRHFEPPEGVTQRNAPARLLLLSYHPNREQGNTSKTLSNLIPHSQLPTYHAHVIPSNEPDLDNIDEEMSRTTVDEYFEDELDTSALPLEPTPVDMPRIDAYCKTATATDAVRPTHLQPPTVAPPVPCRGSSVGPRSSATHYALTQTGHGRRLPFGVRPMTGFEPGEAPPLEDYVIVNPDGSEAERFTRNLVKDTVEGHPVSIVGRIFANPTAYMVNHPRAQRCASPTIPDVATVDSPPKSNVMPPEKTTAAHIEGVVAPTTRLAARPPSYPSGNSRTTAYCARQSQNLDTLRPTISGTSPTKMPPMELAPGALGRAPSPWKHSPTTEFDIGQAVTQATGQTMRSSPVGVPGSANSQQKVPSAGHPVLTASGEYQVTTEPVRLRPHSGGGILDYGKAFTFALCEMLLSISGANGMALAGLWAATEFSDEQTLDTEHNEEIKTVTMVLELCELLSELAERRASVLADCTVTTSSNSPSHSPLSSPGAATNIKHSKPTSPVQNKPGEVASDDSAVGENSVTGTPSLKFLSEAQRIVEQIVLYRRVLYYLEYVFVQVKKAFHHRRLKSTATSRRRLSDCNALYHRCYIRLRQLARQSRRDDLIEPVGRLLANITANRLIFQYALVQCQAAEMDDYVGDIAQSLQRYKAGITLIHGLRQHAKSVGDKTLLADCMRLLHERYNSLRLAAAKAHRVGRSGRTAALTEMAAGQMPDRLPLLQPPVSNAAVSLDLLYPNLGSSPTRLDSGVPISAANTPLHSSPSR